jgi:hypothetical protein
VVSGRFVVGVYGVVETSVVDQNEVSVPVLEEERVGRARCAVFARHLLASVTEVGVVTDRSVLNEVLHLLEGVFGVLVGVVGVDTDDGYLVVVLGDSVENVELSLCVGAVVTRKDEQKGCVTAEVFEAVRLSVRSA